MHIDQVLLNWDRAHTGWAGFQAGVVSRFVLFWYSVADDFATYIVALASPAAPVAELLEQTPGRYWRTFFYTGLFHVGLIHT